MDRLQAGPFSECLNELVLNLDRLLPHHSEPGCSHEAIRRDRVFASDHEASEPAASAATTAVSGIPNIRVKQQAWRRLDKRTLLVNLSVLPSSKLNLFYSDKKEPRTRVESK